MDDIGKKLKAATVESQLVRQPWYKQKQKGNGISMCSTWERDLSENVPNTLQNILPNIEG